MKTAKLKYFYFSILICMFVLSVLAHTLVHATQTIPGVQRLEEGIAAYEHGEYDNAIFKLEMAAYKIPAENKDKLWDAHCYLGLSYLLMGDADEAKKEFGKAQEIIENKLPDAYMHSPKIVKLFKDALELPGPDIEMVFVKGGCFYMGNPSSSKWSWEKDEKPVHEVCVDDFYMGKYEITQGQWEEIMGNNPSKYERGSNYPVHFVSWDDVQGFIKKLKQKTGRNYRLPTEAEWEYASKSGGKREEWAGTSNEKELGRYAWYSENSYKVSHPVGQKEPNGLGLYDMIGNVDEWCQDLYGSKAYKKHQRSNPIYLKHDFIRKGFSGLRFGKNHSRVVRGGTYFLPSSSMSTYSRDYATPDYRNGPTGFRLARTVD